jgi:hypothetical protein
LTQNKGTTTPIDLFVVDHLLIIKLLRKWNGARDQEVATLPKGQSGQAGKTDLPVGRQAGRECCATNLDLKIATTFRACVKIGFKIINFHFIEYKDIKMQINKYLFANFEFSHRLFKSWFKYNE